MAVAYGRYIFYVTAVSLLKPLCGGFRIETATWIQKWFKKNPLGLLEIEISIYKRFFEAGAMGVVIAGDPKPGSEIHGPM